MAHASADNKLKRALIAGVVVAIVSWLILLGIPTGPFEQYEPVLAVTLGLLVFIGVVT